MHNCLPATATYIESKYFFESKCVVSIKKIVRPVFSAFLSPQDFPSALDYMSPWDSHLLFLRVLVQIVRVPYKSHFYIMIKTTNKYQRTNGPVNAHLISWPSKAQNIQNLENIW